MSGMKLTRRKTIILAMLVLLAALAMAAFVPFGLAIGSAAQIKHGVLYEEALMILGPPSDEHKSMCLSSDRDTGVASWDVSDGFVFVEWERLDSKVVVTQVSVVECPRWRKLWNRLHRKLGN